MKLDENNYLIWKNQLLNAIIANGLEDFIDGCHPCPIRFLDSQIQIVNLDFTTWHRFNRLIMSWIYASLTERMLYQIVGYSTALEIWYALNQICSTASMARLIEIHAKIKT